MKRREFITLLAGSAAWPLAARAEQAAMPVVGWLSGESRDSDDYRVVPFRQGLKAAGYVEGQGLAIEYRFAEGQYDRLPELATDLARRDVAVIASGGAAAAIAAKAVTTTIPVVFQIGDDPVRLGLVASLGRPGGNLTGVTSLNVEVAPKQIELLHELAPTANIIALLTNPTNAAQTEAITAEAHATSRRLGLDLHVVPALTEGDFDAVFAALIKLRAAALVIAPDSLFGNWSGRLGALALRHAIPAISPYREFTTAGGLMSYGTSITSLYRQVGMYAGRILRGEKPADLPVQQAVKIELLINLKTAKALGLSFPITLLGRADEVIE